jgi:hypothetical protein
MKKQPHQYLARPCAGREELGLSPNHIYRIIDPNDKEIGEMTLEEAEKKFGKKNVYVSASHDLCDKCYESLMGANK